MVGSPIVILAAPRSGSSMTAGLFHLHGCWVGRCKAGNENNPKGYFENQDIKSLLLKYFGKMDKMTPGESHPDFKDEVLKLNPTNPWCVKHGAMYFGAWEDFNPTFILVRRNFDSIVKSSQRVRFANSEKILEKNVAMLDYVEREYGAMNVYTDELIKGNYDSLEESLEYCGLHFREDITREFIEPEYWHC